MFTDLYKVEAFKKAYNDVGKELTHLYQLDGAQNSGSKKWESIKKLEAERANIKAEFDATIQSVKDWCSTLPPEDKEFADLVLSFFCDINSLQSGFKTYLELLGNRNHVSNVNVKIKKLWLDSFK